MLNRDQQQLLGSLGAGMAADALLDGLRERGTLEGGRSADQAGCWINYNRKAVWLEDHSEFSAALRAAGDDSATDATQAWRRIRPKIVLKVTWAQAAIEPRGVVGFEVILGAYASLLSIAATGSVSLVS